MLQFYHFHMEGMVWPGTENVVIPAMRMVVGYLWLIPTLLDAGDDSWILMQESLYPLFCTMFTSEASSATGPADCPLQTALAVGVLLSHCLSSPPISLTFWPSLRCSWGHMVDHSSTALIQQPVNLPRLVSMAPGLLSALQKWNISFLSC